MPELTTVTGTLYDAAGAVKAGVRFTVRKVVKDGVLVSNRPVDYYSDDEDGVVTFSVHRDSTAWIDAAAVGFDTRPGRGVAVTIPDAETATLEELLPASLAPSSGVSQSTFNAAVTELQEQIDDAGGSSPLMMAHAAGVTVAPSSTYFGTFAPVPTGATATAHAATALNATESNRQILCPVAKTLQSFYVKTNSAQPADGSLVLTVRINGVGTGIVITIPADAPAGTFSDTAHTADIEAGDLISFSVANASASSNSAALTHWSVVLG